jgi:C-terminal processing protease CtpA/Prc
MVQKVTKIGVIALFIITICAIGCNIVHSIISTIKLDELSSRFDSKIDIKKDSIYKKERKLPEWLPTKFDEQSRLFFLCKVWGYMKYYAENKYDTKISVDNTLFLFLDRLLANPKSNQVEFNNLLKEMIFSMQVDSLCGNNPFPNIDDYVLISNGWMKDTVCLNEENSQLLQDVFSHHKGITNKWVGINNIGIVQRLFTSDYSDIQNPNVRLWGLFDFWNFINYFYPNKNYMDQSWDLSLYEAIPEFVEADNETKYRKAIYRLINQLKDTHSSYPATIDQHLFGKYRPMFRMMRINDTFMINKIRDREHYEDAFVQGDIVLAIDGKAIHSYYDSLQQYTCGGNKWSNQRFVCNALLSRRENKTHFTILRNKDTLEFESHNLEYETLYQHERKPSKKESEPLYKWIDNETAYLDLKCLTRKNFKKNYYPIKDASVIIIDLRNYPELSLVIDIADNFVPVSSSFALSSYVDIRFPGLMRYCNTSQVIGSNECYKGKIIALVDEQTGSYSEYLTMLLQANPNTSVVGRCTSGANGNINSYKFPGNVEVIYTAIGILYPDLSPTQRTGVRVDYYVEPTLESILEDKDLVLEKAIMIANENNDSKE